MLLSSRYMTSPIVPVTSRIQTSAGKIVWQESGRQGLPKVIFLHGAYGDSRQWEGVMGILGESFHCFAPDLFGYGESIPNESVKSIACVVNGLKSFIDTLRLNRFYLIGHSIGAWVAASYALSNSDRVRGLLLTSPWGVDSSFMKEVPKSTRWFMRHPRWQRGWLGTVKTLDSLWDGIVPLGKTLSFWDDITSDPTTYKLLYQRSPALIAADTLADRLPALNLPLLLLQGEPDLPYATAQSQAFYQIVPRAQREILRATDFFLDEDLPEFFEIHSDLPQILADSFTNFAAKIERTR